MELILNLAIIIAFLIYFLSKNIFRLFKKYKYSSYYILVIIVVILSVGIICFSIFKMRQQRIKNRTINVLVQADGDIYVEDIWDINIVDSSTLYQSFNEAGLNNFSDIKVSYLDKDDKWVYMKENKRISRDGREPLNYYHAGYFQNNYEIAWGVGLENSRGRRQYKIEYTLKGATKKYLDIAEYYHMFVGKDFEIPIENFQATIIFPAPLKEETAYIFGHGAETGQINFNQGKVQVKARNVKKNTFIEARVLFPKGIIYMAPEIKINRKEKILAEEKNNFENTIFTLINDINRDRILKEAIAGIMIYIAIVIVLEVSQTLKFKQKYPKDKVKKWERYTGLPQTGLNILAANVIYEDKGSKNFLVTVLMKLVHNKVLEIIEIKDNIDFNDQNISFEYFDESIKEKSRILKEVAKENGIHVNLMEVAKIYAKVEKDYRKEQASELKIKVKDINKIKFKLNLKKAEETDLDTDELMVIEFLKRVHKNKIITETKFVKNAIKLAEKYNIPVNLFPKVSRIFTQEIEIDKGQIYIEQYQLINMLVNNFKEFDLKHKKAIKEIKEKAETKGIYDKSKELKRNTIIYKLILEIGILIFLVFLVLNIFFGTIQFNEVQYIIGTISILIVSAIFIGLNVVQSFVLFPPLTLLGMNIREEYKGLYNFLDNDSFIAEYPETSIVIWGEFLVLASYFGIAKRLLEALRKVNPDLFTELETYNYSSSDVYEILRIIDTTDLSVRNIAMSNTNKAFSNTSSFISRSGSRGSGGFGGGGGFTSGGRRWVWWRPEVVVVNINKIKFKLNEFEKNNKKFKKEI